MSQAESSLEFKVTIPFEKSVHEDGGWYIRGVAAGLGVDKDGDAMMPEAIEMLANQINTAPVPFRNHHNKDDIMEDMGEVVKASVTSDFELMVEVQLDQDNPSSQYLWKKLDQGKQYGMSVRGDTERPRFEKAQSGRYVHKHHTVTLKEVSVTTRPFYTKSLGTVLRKAMTDAEASFATGENTTMEDSNTGETQTPESTAPVNDTVVEGTASPSDELVKSLMDNEAFTTFMTEQIITAVAASAAVEGSVEDTTEVVKSETEESTDAPDITELVKSLTTELNSSFDAKIDKMMGQIADSATPRVLVKSEAEEAAEAIEAFKSSEPRNRLRVGLAATHGETDKL